MEVQDFLSGLQASEDEEGSSPRMEELIEKDILEAQSALQRRLRSRGESLRWALSAEQQGAWLQPPPHPPSLSPLVLMCAHALSLLSPSRFSLSPPLCLSLPPSLCAEEPEAAARLPVAAAAPAAAQQAPVVISDARRKEILAQLASERAVRESSSWLRALLQLQALALAQAQAQAVQPPLPAAAAAAVTLWRARCSRQPPGQ